MNNRFSLFKIWLHFIKNEQVHKKLKIMFYFLKKAFLEVINLFDTLKEKLKKIIKNLLIFIKILNQMN